MIRNHALQLCSPVAASRPAAGPRADSWGAQEAPPASYALPALTAGGQVPTPACEIEAVSIRASHRAVCSQGPPSALGAPPAPFLRREVSGAVARSPSRARTSLFLSAGVGNRHTSPPPPSFRLSTTPLRSSVRLSCGDLEVCLLFSPYSISRNQRTWRVNEDTPPLRLVCVHTLRNECVCWRHAERAPPSPSRLHSVQHLPPAVLRQHPRCGPCLFFTCFHDVLPFFGHRTDLNTGHSLAYPPSQGAPPA
jgi:hypothetical protein